MKQIPIGLAAVVALMGTPALAADMAVKAPPPAAAPVASWAGFYLGGNVGGGIATADVFDPDCFFCNDSALHGGFAEVGGQAGYNWQFGHAVVGLEGDVNWQSFNRSTGVIETTEITSTKLDAFASLRLRAGLAFDRTFAYVTFGPAFAHANSVSTQFTDAPLTTIAQQATDHRWHDGIAAGAGIEYQLAPHWAVRGEYLHMDFRDSLDFLVPIFPPPGRKNYAYSEELARVGLDYQFGGGTVPAASAAAPIFVGKARPATFPAAAAGWSGFYLGGNAGAGMAGVQFLDPDCYTCSNASYHRAFAALGGQFGYDAQWNSLVLGVVGDVDWTSLDQSGLLARDQNVSEGIKTRAQMNALASVRGRAGVAVDRTLFYVTAGPAFGHFNTSSAYFPAPGFPNPPTFAGAPDRVATDDSWHVGIAAGAGVEFLVDPHWSLFGEYVLYEFPSTKTLLQPPTTAFTPNATTIYGYAAQVARVGANYSFAARGPAASAPTAPAVAANWQGFYLGANAGGGLLDADAMEMDCFLCADMTSHVASAVLGAQGGYNWQWGATVLGLEADLDWASVNSSRDFALTFAPTTGTLQQKMDGVASLRGRAGLAVDNALLYVTAGPAIGHFKENLFFAGTPIAYPTDGWQPGLAAGAGVAYKLDPHWSLRAEYLHLAFADKILNCGANFMFGSRNCLLSRMQYANSAEVARVGIDYLFDAGKN